MLVFGSVVPWICNEIGNIQSCSTLKYIALAERFFESNDKSDMNAWHILGGRLIPLGPLSLVGFYM